MIDSSISAGEQLNELLISHSMEILGIEQVQAFERYCSLLLRWNARMNLTAIRDVAGIHSRHFLESIVAARALPAGISTLLDFGSGAGFPGIPIALCRPEISVTLAESHGKKAAFLQEAVRTLGLSTKVHSSRAELLSTLFDCVTLRAVDHMDLAVTSAAKLVCAGGWLLLMTTGASLASLHAIAGSEFAWQPLIPLSGSEDRVIGFGQRK